MRQQASKSSDVSSAEEKVSVAEAAAAVAHAASVPGVPLQQVRAKAKALASLLDEHKDEQILKESCLDLCQLFGEGIQNDRIQSILEAAVVPKLVHLLEPVEKRNGVFEFRVPVSVQSAALQVIGNIACGDDRQTQVIIDCNVLPSLRALLTCDERSIRKECCWIISNISESAHQVQDVIDAGILPYLLRLLESQDAACREDATWVLYNVTANRDEKQIDYLAEQGCVRALCSLLSCTKELDVNWKGCGTIAEVALKGLRNVLAVGEFVAHQTGRRLNKYAAVVVNSYGVERVEALTHNSNFDIRMRARALLTSFFGAESIESELGQHHILSISSPSGESSSSADTDLGEEDEEDDDDSLFDLNISAVEKCSCSACSDLSKLPDKRSPKNPREESGKDASDLDMCECCGANDIVGKTRTVLSIKTGRAVRLGHRHCLAVLLSRMTWSQRVSAIQAPSGVYSNLLPPEAALTSSLPAFVLAAQGGKADCLELIVRRCQPDLDMVYGKKRLTALAWAAHKGNLRCCKILRENGASVNTKCADLVTALHLAASTGSVAVCKFLIDQGCLIDVPSSKRQTPLCLASQRGHANVVRLLLREGARTMHEDEQKLTPLHLAALNGHDAVVSVLIDAGADANAENVTGTTPICYAVQRRHARCVRLLIHGGAKLSVPGSSPLLFIAADEGDVECVKALLDANTELTCRANIKVLINKDYEMMDSLSPLHLAASKGHDGVVELLLERGVDVDERSSKGWSALDFAVLNGHVTSASALIFYGAIVDEGPKVIGRGSWTLVQHAAHSGNKEIVRLLIQRLQEQKVQGLQGVLNGVAGDVSYSVESIATSYTVESKRRTRELRDDDRDSHRSRDLKKWELEANEAKERLEEAMKHRSISKMKEAIAFANKVLLHMAAGAGAVDDDLQSPADSSVQHALQTISVSLSNELEKNRRVLAEEQLLERKKKEKRDADAANLRRENARKLIRDALDLVKGGSDPRILQRSMKKAHNVLDESDECIRLAKELLLRISRSQEIDRKLSTALAESQLDQIVEAVSDLENETLWHEEEESTRALSKALNGEYKSRITDAKERATILRNEIEAAKAAEEQQRRAEREVLARLEKASKTGSPADIERCLLELVDFSSKNTEVRASVNGIKKSFQKLVKNERKKLRQACATEDRETIKNAHQQALEMNLRALKSDVAAAETALLRLEERELVLSEMESAVDAHDLTALQRIKVRLEELGMLDDAERVLEDMRGGESTWPDGRRLLDLIKRGRQFDSSAELVADAEKLARELGAAGADLIGSAVSTEEPRSIASAIEAYSKAFNVGEITEASKQLFDLGRGIIALEDAKSSLARIQLEEQAKELAEAEAQAAAMKAAIEARNRDEVEEDTQDAPSEEQGEVPLEDNQNVFEDGISDNNSSETAVCTHYYLWKGGTLVACSRCGNERNSTNLEWLARVKKRTLKGMDMDDSAIREGTKGTHEIEYPVHNGYFPASHLADLGLREHKLPPFEVPAKVVRERPLISASGPEPAVEVNPLRTAPVMEDSTADISEEFAMQNFGFDIDAIIDDS
ncbi:hypothetical protein NDN08_007456 [Rhodosorus marinus]|uniref:Uncharacterized protein n=1 Tax=Rhodosorus marinus TaxID=101924 RepID=A0AAV8V1U7_9RHOD|nr:hypothetical protein NDN08_007456 [Rhodosorus marinus]